MSLALALLQYYRQNRKAIQNELAPLEETGGLKFHLEVFESQWRGAQHLLRKPHGELGIVELNRVRPAAFALLTAMMWWAGNPGRPATPPVTQGLFALAPESDALIRREFIDEQVKETLRLWYWRLRGSRSVQFNYKWLGTGVERMLSLELWNGDVCAKHTVYFTLPPLSSTLGADLHSIQVLTFDVCRQAETLLGDKGNFPDDEEAEKAAARAARNIADNMFSTLLPQQRARLKNREDIVLAAYRAAMARV